MQTRFLATLNTLPATLQSSLHPCLSHPYFSGVLTALQVETVKQACKLDDDELACALLPLAASCARTAVSNFNVGALVRGKSGHLYFGANMEFPGMSLQHTVHAEQSAITHAWLSGESGLAAIYVNHPPVAIAASLSMNSIMVLLCPSIYQSGHLAH
jgi:cytidine deaminase